MLIMVPLTHVNVNRLKAVSLHAPHLAIITEYAEKGNLYDLLQDPELKLRWSDPLLRLSVEVSDGLAYLHANKVIHFDIKSANILVMSTFTARITDFGTAIRFTGEKWVVCLVGACGRARRTLSRSPSLSFALSPLPPPPGPSSAKPWAHRCGLHQRFGTANLAPPLPMSLASAFCSLRSRRDRFPTQESHMPISSKTSPPASCCQSFPMRCHLRSGT